MEDHQFDATKGGSEHLPFSANSLKFSSSRSIEIAAMTESILRPSKTKLIFQTLPVHMRRRVMSHNCKRLPRRLRQGHMKQLEKSGLPPKQKRPSRKYRRRPGNLCQEYNRRQQRVTWLETHIWHAKRFHMTERWGYKLAEAPCDKAFRACYRASSAHCLMQDISFYSSIRIKGPITEIANVFKSITNHDCGLSVVAKAFLSGSREGWLHIFKPESYPKGYVGKINYIWEPISSLIKNVWLFIHPAIYEEIYCIILEAFHNLTSFVDKIPEKKRKIASEIPNINCSDIIIGNCKITFLKQSFNRFRLTGPKSHAILSRSLKCIDNIDSLKQSYWASRKYSENSSKMYLKEKNAYWESLQCANSSAQLPPRLVIGLIVKDPRLMRPNKRTKAYNNQPEELPTTSSIHIPDFAASSPLWNSNIQKDIKDKMLTNTQLIKKVTETQLIPGEIFEDDPEVQGVPVLLVQRPGSQEPSYKKNGFASGWDIILPAGYSLPFWQTFVMFGARAGGLRETKNLSLEIGECYLPPDSEAGRQEEVRIESLLKERYFRLPPNKRLNYIKLGVNSPFMCHWKFLLTDWANSTIESFYVLRNKNLLIKLQEALNNKRSHSQDKLQSCLVPVYLQIEGKGILSQHAIVCLPSSEDVKNIKTLFEPLHEDPNAKLRKELRRDNKAKILKRRRQKVKLKKKNIKVESKPKGKPEISAYMLKMRELWLPKIENVRNSCSREVMGFITQGAFSFTEAKGCGVGYIAYNALLSLLKQGQNLVLVRNVTSRKYSLASFKIILQQ